MTRVGDGHGNQWQRGQVKGPSLQFDCQSNGSNSARSMVWGEGVLFIPGVKTP